MVLNISYKLEKKNILRAGHVMHIEFIGKKNSSGILIK